MRITGGINRGRVVKMPSAGVVRPTQDSVREALFSMLREIVPDSVFLDLFAGTGAVGLDAKSRGASEVIWVERDKRVAAVLEENIKTICGSMNGLQVVKADAMQWLSRPSGRKHFVTIGYADPPYTTEEKSDGIDELLAAVAKSEIMVERGVFVVEQRVGSPEPLIPTGWELISERKYGKTRLCLLRVKYGVGVEPSAEEQK